eukprot:m.470187 g.470187  ORF g.470187 m.470187 type:complete len:102 (+) comp29495_c0_seq1:2091-2396(+)
MTEQPTTKMIKYAMALTVCTTNLMCRVFDSSTHLEETLGIAHMIIAANNRSPKGPMASTIEDDGLSFNLTNSSRSEPQSLPVQFILDNQGALLRKWFARQA